MLQHHGRMKHLDLRFYWLRDMVELGSIRVKHLRTEDMPADLLTKPLGRLKVNTSRGGSTPHPRMPGRLLPCRGVLTLAGEASPSRHLAPNPLVWPGLPLVREGGPLQGSPSPFPPALERPTQKSRHTPASLTSLSLWTCQRPVTNESP